MEKSLDIMLTQQLNVDEMPNLGDIPALGERARELIVKRKKKEVSSTQSQLAVSFLDMILSKYKIVSLTFCVIGILSAINFLMTFTIDTGGGKISGMQADSSLTVSSNTYLATLNQSTIVETPANTSTALTSISTFKN